MLFLLFGCNCFFCLIHARQALGGLARKRGEHASHFRVTCESLTSQASHSRVTHANHSRVSRGSLASHKRVRSASHILARSPPPPPPPPRIALPQNTNQLSTNRCCLTTLSQVHGRRNSYGLFMAEMVIHITHETALISVRCTAAHTTPALF